MASDAATGATVGPANAADSPEQTELPDQVEASDQPDPPEPEPETPRPEPETSLPQPETPRPEPETPRQHGRPISPPPRPAGPNRWPHILVLSSYLAIALALLNNLWRHLPLERLAIGGTDQYMLEWYLWYGPHALFHGHNPFFTTLWNPPTGANVIGNTSVLGLGLPLSPVTLLFGPRVTLIVALVLGMAGSGAAWYWFFRRVVPGSVLGAALGGGFCAFAPAMVSHANGGHLNLVVTGLIPFISWHALRLREPGRAGRSGVPLGLLVVYQFFLGAEEIMLTALGLGLFCLCYAVFRPRAALAAVPPMVRGLAVAVLVALPFLAYPVWFLLAGPQSYSGVQSASTTVNDIFSIFTLPAQSFIGDPASTAPFVRFHNEENAFFGAPLLVITAFGIWRLRRELLAKVSAVMIVLACLLSFGSVIHFDRHSLIPGPWVLFRRIPLFDSMIVSRLTFLAIPFFGLMLALMTVRLRDDAGRPAAEAARVRRFGMLAIVAALVSVAPAPLADSNRPPVPQFITSGEWRQTINPGSNIMTVPMTMAGGGLDTVNWQIPADGGFSLVGGYFLQPHGADRTGHSAPVITQTQQMINELWQTGKPPKITEATRAQARTDLADLAVDDIVVTSAGHSAAVRDTLTQLLGVSPRHISDVWTWKLKNGVAITVAS